LAADRDSLIGHSQQEDRAMMGERLVMQESLFYEFRLEDHVPSDHLLRRIDRFVDCSGCASISPASTAPQADPLLIRS
jgi:hypothetical protein